MRHGAYGLFWPSYPERLFIMNIPLFYERKTRSDIIIIYYRTQSLNGLFNAVIGEILLSTTINRVATNTSCGEKSLDQLRRNASCPECFIYGINYHLPLLMLLLLTLLRTNTTAGWRSGRHQSWEDVLFILFFFISTLFSHYLIYSFNCYLSYFSRVVHLFLFLILWVELAADVIVEITWS